MPQSNPYWQKALQHQQRQGQQQQPGKINQPRIKIKEGFDPELLDKGVEIEVVKGVNVAVIRGKVVDVSKYWLKLLVDGGVIYVNKAAVISIKPLQ